MPADGQAVEASNIAQRRSNALDDGTPAYLERRREIIASAAKAFKRRGYRATSLSDIAREAGTDRATVYYYVSGKAELFDEIVSEAVEANTLTAEAIRAGRDPAPVKLETLIGALMDSYAANYPYLYVYVQEDLSHVAPERAEWSQRMRRLNNRYVDALAGIMRDGVEEGTLRATGTPQLMAYALMGMLGWTNRWFHPHDGPYSASDIAATFSATFLRGVEDHPQG